MRNSLPKEKVGRVTITYTEGKQKIIMNYTFKGLSLILDSEYLNSKEVLIV